MNAETVLRGTIKADGTLDVPGPLALPPGPVEVTVRAIPTAAGEDLLALLARFRAEQQASGHVPRTADELDAGVRQMRDEWEERQVAIEQLKDECRRDREASNAAKGPPTRSSFSTRTSSSTLSKT